MANFNPLSNYGYAAIVKEATAGTAVTPTTYFRTISDDIAVEYARDPVTQQSGSREKNIRSAQGLVSASGPIEFYVEPRMIGHFLRQLFGAPQTIATVASTSYRHVFTVADDDKTYTIDINKADSPWVMRYFGCHGSSLSFTKEDNKWKCSVEQMPTKVFEVARVTAATSSGTNLPMDQTSGLTTSDSILVIEKAFGSTAGYTTIEEFTVSAIVDETNITVGSAVTQSLEVGDMVVIKRATITEADWTGCEVFQFSNGTTYEDGVDIDNTSAVTKEDISIEFTNEVIQKYGSGNDEINRFPFDVLTGEYEATGTFSKFFDSQKYVDLTRSAQPIGLRVRTKNNLAISANSLTPAQSDFGISAGGNGFDVSATVAGAFDGIAGNDLNVVFVTNSSDALAAAISGTTITISLADTTASNNTGTLIASAVNALSGVDSSAVGTGVDQFVSGTHSGVGQGSLNLGYDDATGAVIVENSIVGIDANEESYLQFDFAAAVLDANSLPASVSDVIEHEVPFTAEVDSDCTDTARKNWSTRVYLHNDVASY